MEDCKIIELYNERNEAAIQETDKKYGRILFGIAFNLLENREDSEEVVNDTYQRTWNAIPPEKPKSLGAYLGKIARNLSINRWHEKRTQKRFHEAEMLLSELTDVIPDSATTESKMDERELTDSINRLLGRLSKEDRVLFLKRYWYGESVKGLAKEFDIPPKKLASRLYRLRQYLKKALEEEGIRL
jgi:RNA polymerase sigma factor (sigma-70 family)